MRSGIYFLYKNSLGYIKSSVVIAPALFESQYKILPYFPDHIRCTKISEGKFRGEKRCTFGPQYTGIFIWSFSGKSVTYGPENLVTYNSINTFQDINQ
jgi:hypothetical protein